MFKQKEVVSMVKMLQSEAVKLGMTVKVSGNEVTFVLSEKAVRNSAKPVAKATPKTSKPAKKQYPKSDKPKLYKPLYAAMGITEPEKLSKAIEKAAKQYQAATGKKGTASTHAYWVYCQNPKLLGHDEPMQYDELLSQLTGWKK